MGRISGIEIRIIAEDDTIEHFTRAAGASPGWLSDAGALIAWAEGDRAALADALRGARQRDGEHAFDGAPIAGFDEPPAVLMEISWSGGENEGQPRTRLYENVQVGSGAPRFKTMSLGGTTGVKVVDGAGNGRRHPSAANLDPVELQQVLGHILPWREFDHEAPLAHLRACHFPAPADEPSAGRSPTLNFVDEYAAFHLDSFADLLTQGRSKRSLNMSRHHFLSVVLPIGGTDALESDAVQDAIRAFREAGGETRLDTDGEVTFRMTFDGECGEETAPELLEYMQAVAAHAQAGAEVEVNIEGDTAGGEFIGAEDQFVGPSTAARARAAARSHLRAYFADMRAITGESLPSETRRELQYTMLEAFSLGDEPSPDDAPSGPNCS